jgi:hypothetical protein
VAIVDDYAGIAAELRRIQAERGPKPEIRPARTQVATSPGAGHCASRSIPIILSRSSE